MVVFVVCTAAFGQDNRPVPTPLPESPRPADRQPQDPRGNALRQLGLSQEQVQQIRRITVERRPIMEAAQLRFREANKALDAAIYADQVNEHDIDECLKAVQLAQAETAKVRSMNELAVRKILTPDQLIRFRELRRRFDQARETFEMNRQMNRDGGNGEERPAPEARPQMRQMFRQNRPRQQF